MGTARLLGSKLTLGTDLRRAFPVTAPAPGLRLLRLPRQRHSASRVGGDGRAERRMRRPKAAFWEMPGRLQGYP